MKASELFGPHDTFVRRHIGPSEEEIPAMLDAIGVASLDALADETIPAAIRLDRTLEIGPERGEHELLEDFRAMVSKNKVARSLIGMGYYDCITPPVIQRNILENPGWYTQYTPYQPEIAQGRLEALVNFQTMVADLTALPLANASLLDEATAAAEAMSMCYGVARGKKNRFFVAAECHPQTIEVVKTRAEPLGIELTIAPLAELDLSDGDCFGVLVQYPATDGTLVDHRDMVAKAHDAGALVVMATDLLALALLTPPGELGADIAVGSAQRFGVPLGAGGPHAGFLSTKDEHRRHVPGRIIGVSKDVHGHPGYRLALQTREQHIRRDKATSNICTAQVLLAIMSGMYAVYHGPDGVRRIAERVHGLTLVLAAGLKKSGFELASDAFFDTLRVKLDAAKAETIFASARRAGINLRRFDDGDLGVALDETCDASVVDALFEVFGASTSAAELGGSIDVAAPKGFERDTAYLQHPVFNAYHSEHEMLRYMHRLESKDLSLNTSMIALGSCTMKLNATSEMIPVTWPELGRIHPFAPHDQLSGYDALFTSLEAQLAEITGFAAVSLQPNAGSQGEYSGLLVIRAYHRDHDGAHRDVCLIPTSAHGTNPASAVMAGMKVVPVKCDDMGNVDLADLEAKAVANKDNLAALMITYPSTHGVFEAGVKDVCRIIHDNGGLVYLDGANMNAQVGLCRPGDYGADVCHLNLHKTFCIPHGGGGPGMGPIGVTPALAPYLPSHPMAAKKGERAIGPIAAAPYGSPSILPISWVYISLMGSAGLQRATQVAILAANYMAKRLEDHYPILYRGKNGRVAHEFIVDMRPFKKSAGIEVDDIAKRLMDYGFHAPTMSFPVAGTMMIEPTESESKEELDRFCEAMIAIREEIREIEAGGDREDNALKRAPHTAADVTRADWDRPYARDKGAFPAAWSRQHKYWPAVGRIDNAWGDRNLMCTCPPMEAFEEQDG